MRLSLLFIAVLLIGFTACDETENFVVDFKYDYFPLEIGKYITYNVDSVTYSSALGGGIQIDSASYEWRETVVDTFRDNENNLVYEVERERRDSASQDWRLVNVLTVTQTQTRLEYVENNRRFVKMFFPLRLEDTSNVFQYFDEFELVAIRGEVIEAFKSWEYLIEDLDVPSDAGTFTFDSTATIRYANSENAIELREASERYAKGIGLIYKEMKILDTQCIEDCIGQTWEEKAEQGFILRLTLKDYN